METFPVNAGMNAVVTRTWLHCMRATRRPDALMVAHLLRRHADVWWASAGRQAGRQADKTWAGCVCSVGGEGTT